jgi:hypothetical protein
MRRSLCYVAAMLFLSASCAAWAQASASLLVTTDTTCDWKLDGQSQGRLNADDVKLVKTVGGDHLIQATSADGQLKWQGMVTADPSVQKMVKIPLSDMAVLWTDPATGLTWTKNDNGSEANWNLANAYCANLQLGGKSGWRLPTIDELQGIYDPSVNIPGQLSSGQAVTWHVKGNLHLSGYSWSSSPGRTSGDVLYFTFDGGLRYIQNLRFDPIGNLLRALCVRRSGE